MLKFKERLMRLQLIKLEERTWGDMIEVYKILNGFVNIDYLQFFNHTSKK